MNLSKMSLMLYNGTVLLRNILVHETSSPEFGQKWAHACKAMHLGLHLDKLIVILRIRTEVSSSNYLKVQVNLKKGTKYGH